MLNLVAVRVGSKYGPEYVAILFDQLLRNLTNYEGELRCWCITDDPESLPEGVTAIAHDPDLPGWWQKVALFSPYMPWAVGERCAYFDLDLCVTGRLEDLIATKGIIQDWKWDGCYNSSVMVWDHGEHADAWKFFTSDVMTLPGKIVPPHALPEGQVNGGDQEWITEAGKWATFPPEWCVNYTDSATFWPPEGCKVVSFNGALKPHEVTDGWVQTVWKIGGLTSLPEMKGVNTSKADLMANVRVNVARDLPWFQGAWPHARVAAVICGGPSLRDSISAIKSQKRRGARIISVNNTLRFLRSHGITPDAHVMLDARPENGEFLDGAPAGVQYFMASQCHPSLIDGLVAAGRDVTIWHNGVDGSEMEEIAEPYASDNKGLVLVPGGGTVGLRSIWLAFFSGYRKLHIYGMDGSYAGDDHHAYPQALNDGEQVLPVVMGGKSYRCSKWQARQGSEFQTTYREVTRAGMTLFVHGVGLVPDIAAALREQARAAE